MIQHRTKCIIKENPKTDSEYVTYMYFLGPIKVVHIVNLPREGEDHATVYIKIEVGTFDIAWEEEPRKSNESV